MSDTHATFTGSIPENYDTYLGPLLFHHYAEQMARRFDLPDGARLLEVACGTGIVSEALRRALNDDIEIVATDLNQPMLDYAMQKRGGMANLSFRQADAQDLPFEAAAFDALAFQFGIMFLPDKAKGMAEAARVLKPGGTVIISVWDSLSINRFVGVAQETLEKFFPTDPPKFLPMPFSYYDRTVLRELLAAADFIDITIEDLPYVITNLSAEHVARGLVTGNPSILEIEARSPDGPDAVIDAVALALALKQNFGDPEMRLDMQAIMVTGVKPGG